MFFIRLDSVYNQSSDLLQSYHSQAPPPPPPMRSTSCYAVLPSTNRQPIDTSFQENHHHQHPIRNGKKSSSNKDVLQSTFEHSYVFHWCREILGFVDVSHEDLEKIDEVISSVISGHVDIPVECENIRPVYQSRISYPEQHHVICDSSYLPLNQDHLSSQQYDYFQSQESGRTVVAELISSILSNGAPSSSSTPPTTTTTTMWLFCSSLLFFFFFDSFLWYYSTLHFDLFVFCWANAIHLTGCEQV